MTQNRRIFVKLATLGVGLIAWTTQAHAAPHWAYCTLNNVSEAWVSPVVAADGAGGIEQVKAEFLRVVSESYPNLSPRIVKSVACFGEGEDYTGLDRQQMQQFRNRDLKQYSGVHEVHIGPAETGKSKHAKKP